MKIDFTWNNPTEEQMSAFRIASQMKPRGLTEAQAAEFICMAKSSLWYSQAKSWIVNPPDIGNAKIVWASACQIIVGIVDLEYNPDKNAWWYIADRDRKMIAMQMLILADFGMMLKQYRSQTMNITSRGFDIFFDIVLGRNWERKFKKLLKV